MLSVDFAFKIQLDNCLVHGDHPQLAVGLHDTCQLMGFSLADQIAYRMVRMHDLKRRYTMFSVCRRYQLLGNNGFQCIGQLYPDLLLLVRREYINDTVYRAGCTDGMQCGQYQMSRLRRGDRYTDRLKITHFSHEDNIRIFTESCS